MRTASVVDPRTWAAAKPRGIRGADPHHRAAAHTPLFKTLPEAVLAALISHAVSHLWKVSELRRYYKLRALKFWLALATLLGVITIDVLPGLVIGVAAMLLMVVHRASLPHVATLGRTPGEPGAYGDVGRHPGYGSLRGLVVLRLESPLFSVNAAPVRDRIKALVGASDPPPRAVIVDVGAGRGCSINSGSTASSNDRCGDPGVRCG